MPAKSWHSVVQTVIPIYSYVLNLSNSKLDHIMNLDFSLRVHESKRVTWMKKDTCVTFIMVSEDTWIYIKEAEYIQYSQLKFSFYYCLQGT